MTARIYNLHNPSEPVTFKAPTLAVAAAGAEGWIAGPARFSVAAL